MTWRAGASIALREIWDKKIWEARAATVVEDGPSRTMLYVPPHAAKKRAVNMHGVHMHIPTGEWTHVDATSSYRHVLSFAWPSRSYGVLMSWHPTGNKFLGWYVNFQTPMRRTSIGFDSTDHILDITVDPTRHWQWKDEAELKQALDAGTVTQDQADAFRAEGEGVIKHILEREEPFDDRWLKWEADPGWRMPVIDGNWNAITPA
jgi:predicted RNA-binding protein associated with RNAse of E/G family